MNVGFVESLVDGPFDCFVFHDIDLLPEDIRHLYHCSFMPRHLNVAPSNFNYTLPYGSYFGGACSMTEEHIRMVNGWSNKYWGWGSEDDDLSRRVSFKKLSMWRYPINIARYKMLIHKPSAVNKNR
ncbi:UNVERIFIED_CONTAM: hypothetical protein GTU68_011913 [Idotea baltica]|nr:hypothetical protein [Idotea baltica]